MYDLKNVKGRALPYDPTILLLNIQLEDLKQVCQKASAFPGLMRHYSQQLRHTFHLNVHQQMTR